MKSNHNGLSEATPGVDPVSIPNQSNIKKWLVADLDRAIVLLNAIKQDGDLLSQMAVWFEGRIANYQQKPVDDPAQVKIPGL